MIGKVNGVARERRFCRRQFSGGESGGLAAEALTTFQRVVAGRDGADRFDSGPSSSSSRAVFWGSSAESAARSSLAAPSSSASVGLSCSFRWDFPTAAGSMVACQEARRVVPDAATGLRSVRVNIGSAMFIKPGAGTKRSPSSAPSRLPSCSSRSGDCERATETEPPRRGGRAAAPRSASNSPESLLIGA